MGIKDLSRRDVLALRQLQRAERDRRVRDRPATFFPWHEIQQWILDVPKKVEGDTRVVLVSGGNRGGKSKVGMGVLSQLLRRESPINDQLRTTDKYTGEVRPKNDRDPLTIWVVPPTLEKARRDWVSPQDGYGLKHWIGSLYVDYKKSPDLIFYSRPPGIDEEECFDNKGGYREEAMDSVLVKSQDQALETFESSEVDLIIFDEEVQREEVWEACLMRIGTTHGVMMMTYTPLHGLSWSYKRYWKRLVKDGAAKRDRSRCWIYNPDTAEANVVCAQMGSADNPKAKAYASEIRADPSMGEAEKAARLDGEYGYVEGALLPALAGIDVAVPLPEHEPYVVSVLPGQKIGGKAAPGNISAFFMVSDPNKSYGATLAARDHHGNLFFVAEHLEESWPDRRHAQAFKKMERKWAYGKVYRYADPGSAGAQSIVNMADLGVAFDTMPKGAGSVSASIKKLRGMTYIDPDHVHPITGEKGAPRVYFYRPGLLWGGKRESMLASQLSDARQTDNQSAPPDTPHKDVRSKLDLFDCGRYTAVVADGVPVKSDAPQIGRGEPPDSRIPSDESLDDGPDERDPLNDEFFMPEYGTGGEPW